MAQRCWHVMPVGFASLKALATPPYIQGTGSVSCNSVFVRHLCRLLHQAERLEREARVQHPSSHCRDLTCRPMPPNTVRHHPGDGQACLEASGGLGRPLGTPARGRPASAQRRRAGGKGMRMPLWRGPRVGGVGRCWRGRWLWWPCGASLRPWCSWVLAPHGHAWGPRLLGAASGPVAQGLPTQHPHAMPLPPLPSSPQRQRARVLEDLTQETPRVCQHLAVLASPWHGPQHTCRPLPHHHRPSLGLVRRPLLLAHTRQDKHGFPLITCRYAAMGTPSCWLASR
jgi:hypothetical protein